MERESRDFVNSFPPEVVEMIFTNLNPDEIFASLQANKEWNSFIDNDHIIWKMLCKDFDRDDVEEDLANGLSWKMIFKNNYGVKGVIRRWMNGKYSKIDFYDDNMTQNYMAVLDVETWGFILEAELLRSENVI